MMYFSVIWKIIPCTYCRWKERVKEKVCSSSLVLDIGFKTLA